MTPEIPKGWEKCGEDATHGWTQGGGLLALDAAKQYGKFEVGDTDTVIHCRDWHRLGITPVRKVQPIEFTFPGIGGIFEVRPEMAGKTFREVTE